MAVSQVNRAKMVLHSRKLSFTRMRTDLLEEKRVSRSAFALIVECLATHSFMRIPGRLTASDPHNGSPLRSRFQTAAIFYASEGRRSRTKSSCLGEVIGPAGSPSLPALMRCDCWPCSSIPGQVTPQLEISQRPSND